MYKMPKLSDKNKNVSFPTCQNISGEGILIKKELGMFVMKEKIYALQCKMEHSKTIKFGVYFLMGVGTTLVSGVVVSILNGLVSVIPFGFAAIAAIVGVVLALVALIGIVVAVISFFCFIWNVIRDIFSLPGKTVQKAKEEKARKEREQAEAELQAKIDAEAAPYKAMADNGDVGAIKEIAKVYYKNGKKDEAQKLYEEVAQLGDIDAQLKLADNYRHVLSAEEWASKAEKNPNASDGQKEYAQKLKNEIEEYRIEVYQRFRDAEAAKWRRIEEAQRRREAEMNLPVQGDFFAVRPGESCCMNDGNACRFCARRVWVSSEGWCRSSRCYL